MESCTRDLEDVFYAISTEIANCGQGAISILHSDGESTIIIGSIEIRIRKHQDVARRVCGSVG